MASTQTATMAVSSTASVITESMQRLLQVRDLWTRSQKDQLEIGRLLYEERKERLGVGGRGIHEGFAQWLREAGIPNKSAYRRIAEYEISIGIRAEKDDATLEIRDDVPVSPEFWSPIVYPPHSKPVSTDTSIEQTAGRKTWTEEQVFDWLKEKHPAVYAHYEAKGFPRWIPLPPSVEVTDKTSCDYCTSHSSSRSCPIHGWTEKRTDHFTQPAAPPFEYEENFLTADELAEFENVCKTLPWKPTPNERNGFDLDAKGNKVWRAYRRSMQLMWSDVRGTHAENDRSARLGNIVDAPTIVQTIVDKLSERVGRKVNYVSLMCYVGGESHLSWHQHSEDRGHDTPVMIVPCGQERKFSYRDIGSKERRDILTRNGSLVVLPSSFNDTHEHAILDDKTATGTRYAINAKCMDDTYYGETAAPAMPWSMDDAPVVKWLKDQHWSSPPPLDDLCRSGNRAGFTDKQIINAAVFLKVEVEDVANRCKRLAAKNAGRLDDATIRAMLEASAPTAAPAAVIPKVHTYPVEDYSQHPELQATTESRSHGMGLKRLRDIAEQLGIDCNIAFKDDCFVVTARFNKEADARKFLGR